MASAPWYLDNSNKPSLKHQRLRQDGAADSLNDQWYQRGLRAGPAATSYVAHCARRSRPCSAFMVTLCAYSEKERARTAGQ
jgi:hypothetical protein